MLLADDAMISLRYAWNLLHHGQLVWNPGERVMGITNPGWTLIMALCLATGVPQNLAGLPVNVVALAVNLLFLWFMLEKIRRYHGMVPAVLIGTFTGLFMPLLFWSVHGFETAVQTLFVALAIEKVHPKNTTNSPHRALIYLWIAFVIRPDSALIILLFAGFLLLISSAKRKVLKYSLLSILIITGVILFQKFYYGDFLPNTYYLKATGGARTIYGGIHYFITSLWRDGIGTLIVLAGVGIFSWLKNPATRQRGEFFLILIAAWTAYIIWTGGDAFPHARFFMSIIPAISFAASEGTAFILEKLRLPLTPNSPLNRNELLKTILVAAVFGTLCLWQIANLSDFVGPDKNRVDRTAVALQLGRMHLPSSTTIAVFEAGTIPFLLPNFHYIDLLGKNDRHIAHTRAHPGLIGHNKWDFDYSLGKLKPDIICTRDTYENFTDDIARKILANMDKFPKNSVFFPVALWVHPEFVKHYRDNRLPIKTPFGTHWTFARDSFLPNLRGKSP